MLQFPPKGNPGTFPDTGMTLSAALEQILKLVDQHQKKQRHTCPVLLSGNTAAGKSALATALAERDGGIVINADALQVYSCWRVLTARPGIDEEKRAPHRLFGHVSPMVSYSVGKWLHDIGLELQHTALQGLRPIIVGGTGLYFRALTRGLAPIPDVPPRIRSEAAERFRRDGLQALLNDLDPATLARIDQSNQARVLRAWEVLALTGQGLAQWHDNTSPPLLRENECIRVLAVITPEEARARIKSRFEAMVSSGALDEVRAALTWWDPCLPAARAHGAPELTAYMKGGMTLDEACARAITATQQYAKRQRSWFRSWMADWVPVSTAGHA